MCRDGVLNLQHLDPCCIIVKILNAAFTSECTFSVELFIALVLFWGGYHIVQFLMMQVVSMHKVDEFRKVVLVHCKMSSRSSRRLRRNLQWLTFVISSITIGFWIGIRHVEEGFDFGSTPGGTKFFFFGRIHGYALKPFGICMVVASIINFAWSVYAIIPRRLGKLPGRLGMLEGRTTGDDFSTYAIMIGWSFLPAVLWLPVLILRTLDIFLKVAVNPCIEAFTRLLRKRRGLDEISSQSDISQVLLLESGKDGRSGFDGAEVLLPELTKQVYLLNYHVMQYSLTGQLLT